MLEEKGRIESKLTTLVEAAECETEAVKEILDNLSEWLRGVEESWRDTRDMVSDHNLLSHLQIERCK